jgi:aromatic ring-opening dioxygenase catalytic subunit (LigB family)
MVQDAPLRDHRLEQWTVAPAARAAHPREEHLLPLMVAAGAAAEDQAVVGFNDTFAGLRLSSYHFGTR